MALDVDAAAAGASGELGVLPRRDVGVHLAVELHQLFEHHATGRHVDAQGERLGGEDDLDQPADERLLDALLERGQQAGVVGRDAAAQGLGEAAVVKGVQVGVAQGRRVPRRDLVKGRALGVGRQAQAGVHQLGDRLVAAGAAEDEVDGRQQPLALKFLDRGVPARHQGGGRGGVGPDRPAVLP